MPVNQSVSTGRIGVGALYSYRDGGLVHNIDSWYGSNAWMTTSLDTSRITPTENEIRPANSAVRYLIRALP
jgi:hypothetical protein